MPVSTGEPVTAILLWPVSVTNSNNRGELMELARRFIISANTLITPDEQLIGGRSIVFSRGHIMASNVRNKSETRERMRDICISVFN